VKQKLVYAGYVMKGYGGFSALLVLEGKFDGKKRGRPRKRLTYYIIQWMQKKKYDEVKRLAEDKDTLRKMIY